MTEPQHGSDMTWVYLIYINAECHNFTKLINYHLCEVIPD